MCRLFAIDTKMIPVKHSVCFVHLVGGIFISTGVYQDDTDLVLKAVTSTFHVHELSVGIVKLALAQLAVEAHHLVELVLHLFDVLVTYNNLSRRYTPSYGVSMLHHESPICANICQMHAY